ncbi:uncharacterized protein LOC122278487 [Carya illinoinensis]|uniref:uncharacterized protein LOC122278487 n=1 Tax=Carya illinoinensis TaxID=32201 RepID=UPI001C721DDE|nr:uncharacterized protein LOC122278487 [Carya illinoinensis]
MALFQMNPLGSPGPDRFPAQFYQKNWVVVRKDVCYFALQVLNHKGSLNEVNDTYITLIPKVKNPRKVVEYRPISLCNVLYKVVSKTLANMMKLILPKLVSVNQSAFVPGRLILDNTLCLNSVSYSILINGEPQQKFKPTGGICQEDPISLYICILCAETLLALLHKAEERGDITNVPIGRGSTRVSHLFFADDSLLFCQASPMELSNIMAILDTYEHASGQVLNRDKSSVFFSKNTKKEMQAHVLQHIGMKSTGTFEKCLGLPAILGRIRVIAFHSFIDKTWSHIVNWKTNQFSSASKESLLKAVLQAIPLYSMAKEKGGLGYKDLKAFNLAMLAKQSWRMIQDPSSLVSRVLKQKYFNAGELLDAKLGAGPSFAWRSIIAGMHTLKTGLMWRMGDGCSINIWTAKWIPSLPHFQVSTPREPDYWCEKVCDLLEPGQRRWNEELLMEMFSEEEIKAITSIPISARGREDRLTWHLTNNGLYSVKSGYHHQKQLEVEELGENSHKQMEIRVWKRLWKMKVAPPSSISHEEHAKKHYPP